MRIRAVFEEYILLIVTSVAPNIWLLSFKMSKFRESINQIEALKLKGLTYFPVLIILLSVAAFSISSAVNRRMEIRNDRSVKVVLRAESIELPSANLAQNNRMHFRFNDNLFTSSPIDKFSNTFFSSPVLLSYHNADQENIRRIRSGFSDRLKN